MSKIKTLLSPFEEVYAPEFDKLIDQKIILMDGLNLLWGHFKKKKDQEGIDLIKEILQSLYKI